MVQVAPARVVEEQLLPLRLVGGDLAKLAVLGLGDRHLGDEQRSVEAILELLTHVVPDRGLVDPM